MTSILKAETIQDTDGNNIINENSNTITIGASGDTTNIVGTLQNNGSALASGITDIDRWKMSSQTYSNGAVMTTGWSRETSLTGAPHGTGVSESSGVFTFPSTGVYHILFGAYIWSSSTTLTYAGVRIDGSTDGFSSNNTELSLTYANTSTAQDHSPIFADAIYDVTNTSNNKLRFFNTTAGSDMGWYSTRVSIVKLMET